MLWIEDIVESTQTPPFFTNSRIDIISFANLYKVVFRRNAFSPFPSAWNGSELEGGAKSEVATSIFTSGRGFEFTKDV